MLRSTPKQHTKIRPWRHQCHRLSKTMCELLPNKEVLLLHAGRNTIEAMRAAHSQRLSLVCSIDSIRYNQREDSNWWHPSLCTISAHTLPCVALSLSSFLRPLCSQTLRSNNPTILRDT
ncbi:unnamed protein product [Ectocarpus fasciculatus]